MFRFLSYETVSLCKMAAPKNRKFRFKNKLLSMDVTSISLCLALFPWAEFRRTKGAVKLHLLLDHDGYFPTYAYICNGNKHEVSIARSWTALMRLSNIERGGLWNKPVKDFHVMLDS